MSLRLIRRAPLDHAAAMKKSSGCVELEGLGVELLDIANDQVGEMGKTRGSGCDSDTVMKLWKKVEDLQRTQIWITVFFVACLLVTLAVVITFLSV